MVFRKNDEKRNFKGPYLQMQKKKMCIEGELASYASKQLAALEIEVNKENTRVEKERKAKVEELVNFQKQVDFMNSEPTDYKHDLYLIPKDRTNFKAYKVFFTNHPEYFYISFNSSRNKAEAEARKYIKDTYFPLLSNSACPISFEELKGYRIQELDEYAQEGRAPISALLKAGIKFKCSCCGKITFNYEDYAARRCFIVESEGNIVPYAKGMIFCYSCYHKCFD